MKSQLISVCIGLLCVLFIGELAAGPKRSRGGNRSGRNKPVNPQRGTKPRPSTKSPDRDIPGVQHRKNDPDAKKDSLTKLKTKLNSGETKTKFAENSAELQSKFTEFQTKLKDNFDGDPEAMQAAAADLQKSLSAMMDGATKPDPAAVEAVAQDLQAVFSSGNLTPQQMKQLSEDISALLASSNITSDEAVAVANDVQALCEAAGVSKEDAQQLAESLVELAQSGKASPSAEKPLKLDSPGTGSGRSIREQIRTRKSLRR